ncbi:MAG: hypothetical protein QOE59_383 [Actinomycetota bacterium]|jgi:hypothetical protein|nr:hypothetical protein [Actinomycetota bacterium]
MEIVGGAALIAVIVWVAAPWVSMARRKTVDQRTVAGWRREYVVPAPRRAPDDAPVRERSA